jgi:hypothetical protein
MIALATGWPYRHRSAQWLIPVDYAGVTVVGDSIPCPPGMH